MSYTASYIVNSSSAQGTTDFQFTFPYIKEEHIEVYLNYSKLTQGSGSAQYQVITNVSPKLIRLNTGITSANLRVEVRRNSSLATPLVDYADGSTLTANDLDTSVLQSLYIDQELKDNQGKTVSVDEATGLPSMGESSAGNLRLTKVADPTAAQDAATKNYVDTTAEPKSAKLTELATMGQTTANALAELTEAEVQAIDGLTASTDELNKLDGVTATTAELNYVDGVTSNVQTQLDAKQPLDAELTELATMGSTTASALADLTQAEVQILDGATVSTDELNKLDGVTATTTELNHVDGVTSNVQTQLDAKQPLDAELTELATMSSGTASALADLTQAEVETLDGLTATTAELNKLDGVTATTAELNKTDGLTSTPVELNTLDGITSNTSELNKLDGVTASTTELNIVAGKSFKTSSGTLDTTSDTEIPSSKVIAAHVASSQTAIGGFTTIADEVSFPNTQPATGVVVSINNAAGVVINGSGVSTSGKRVDNTTVTINGFPSSLNGETLAAGVGLIVVSTSTANTYSYHKILTSETDVKQLSDDINDFNSRYRIAGSAPGSNNDEGDLYFDTAANKMKVYNGSAWDDVASVGSFFVNTLSGAGGSIGNSSGNFDGAAKQFTLSNPGTSAQQHIVSVNGVIQKPNAGTGVPSEGFAISGNDIIFSAAPASGSDFFIITCGSSVSIGTPSANSVNSSHIIDGSIVDGDISSSAAISEGKLDIHNAPSVGKILKYTSNGMEWGDGAYLPLAGGTLTGDTVISGSNVEFNFHDNVKAAFGTGHDFNIWHDSVADKTNFDGDVRFLGAASNIQWDKSENQLIFQSPSTGAASPKASWGSGGSSYANLNIQLTTSEALISTSHTDLALQSGNSKDINLGSSKDINFWNTSGAGNYYMRLRENSGSDQCVELYYGNTPTKRLETTSSGVNVVGALTVNGAALESSPTLTGVADGALPINKAVYLTSAGKFKAPTTTYVPKNGPTSTTGQSATTINSGAGGNIFAAFNPDSNSQSGSVDSSNGIALVGWRGHHPDGSGYVTEGTIYLTITHGGSTTLATSLITPVTLDTGTWYYASPEVEYMGDNYWFVVWTTPNATGAIKGRTVHWNGSGLDLGTENNLMSNGLAGRDMAIQRISNTRAVVFWNQGDESGGVGVDKFGYRVIDFSGSGTSRTFSGGTDTEVSSSIGTPADKHRITCAYDTTNSKIVTAVQVGNDIKYLAGAISGGTNAGTITWGSTYTLSSASAACLLYDSNDNKLIIKWKAGIPSSSGAITAAVLSTSSSNNNLSTWTTTTSSHSQGAMNGNNRESDGFVSSRSSFWFSYQNDSNSRHHILGFTVSGNTITWISSEEQIHNQNTQGGYRRMIYDSIKDRSMGFSNASSGDHLVAGQQDLHNATYTMTTANYMGFAKAAYSDGDTATIKTFGSTVTGSSLTPGSTYYAQPDGSMATTSGTGTVKAGTAINATTLFLRDHGSF